MSAVVIRALAAGERAAFVSINNAVGWRARGPSFDFHLGRADSALFVAEVGGAPAGLGGATVFPGGTGWVHGIVVDPGFQRAGLGRRLTEAAIAWLRARDVSTVLLLATDAGRPIYERLGFVAGPRYGAFAWPAVDGTRVATPPRPMTPRDLSAVCALDAVATGEDRRALIETLAPAGWVVDVRGEIAGFHLECPWGAGPVIARDVATGLALMTFVAGRQGTSPPRPLGVPEDNAAARSWLAAAGLTAERYVTRMWLGTPPDWRPDMMFGVFNFAVG